MLRVLSKNLWTEIRAVAAKARSHRAAIAYVTEDLVGFKKGDALVTDASPAAIKMGETSARLLQKLHRRGVAVHSCPGLHAKVLLLDDVAVIGSGNLSKSSRSALIEAAVMTDASAAVGGVAAFIEQLVKQTKALDAAAITALTKIKVERRGGRPPASQRGKPVISELGHQTWLLGVYEIADITPVEQRWVDRSREEAAEKQEIEDAEEVSWIKWGASGRVVKDAKPGDWVIQIWRDKRSDKSPASVLKARPLLMKKRRQGVTYLFLGEPMGQKPEVRWGTFKALLKKLGARVPALNSERVLHADLAEQIDRHWKTLPST